MKSVLAIALFISNIASGQNWQEWTRQKKTQIKYLLQQIDASKVYLEFAQKGYSIANKGLNAIGSIKNGDFNLHRSFFGSLKTVNPVIKNSARVADIIALQVKIIKGAKQAVIRAKETGQFTPEDVSYCKIVFDNLLEDCLKNMEELWLVLTHSELTMTDSERLKRIDRLYADMQNKVSFCASFSNEMDVLSIQRMGEQMDIKRSKVFNGLE